MTVPVLYIPVIKSSRDIFGEIYRRVLNNIICTFDRNPGNVGTGISKRRITRTLVFLADIPKGIFKIICPQCFGRNLACTLSCVSNRIVARIIARKCQIRIINPVMPIDIAADIFAMELCPITTLQGNIILPQNPRKRPNTSCGDSGRAIIFLFHSSKGRREALRCDFTCPCQLISNHAGIIQVIVDSLVTIEGYSIVNIPQARILIVIESGYRYRHAIIARERCRIAGIVHIAVSPKDRGLGILDRLRGIIFFCYGRRLIDRHIDSTLFNLSLTTNGISVRIVKRSTIQCIVAKQRLFLRIRNARIVCSRRDAVADMISRRSQPGIRGISSVFVVFILVVSLAGQGEVNFILALYATRTLNRQLILGKVNVVYSRGAIIGLGKLFNSLTSILVHDLKSCRIKRPWGDFALSLQVSAIIVRISRDFAGILDY